MRQISVIENLGQKITWNNTEDPGVKKSIVYDCVLCTVQNKSNQITDPDKCILQSG